MLPQPPLETFQIGWICALPIEAAAATEVLDEKFGLLGAQDASDPNIYTLGRIGQHNIVIACLPAKQYGTTPAATVANNMTRTFSKSLRIGLMVGLGGGIPSATYDIRLGDVVISCPDGTSGGVLQYDMGKVGLAGEFSRTGSLNSPPRSLLTAVNLMKAAEFTDDPCFPKYIKNVTGRTARTQKSFSRPSTQQDRLFQLKYEHPATEISCDRCLPEWEVKRSERESSDPQLHYGIIASGNAVIKHGWTREKLRLDIGALCFEMEAAGLMMDFPCLVIRGICDYADSHKNKQWQGYAALAAASYAKELLGYIPVGHVSQESLVVDACNKLKKEIQATNNLIGQVYNQQEDHHRVKVMEALKVSNYEQYKSIIPERVEGTCQWALQSPEYIHWWKSNHNNLLWVSADPGCGKSVLARSIIDEYIPALSPEVTICYFFFKDNDQQSHLSAALCSLLHQLFSHQPHLLHHAMPSWKNNGEKLKDEVDELWRIFIKATSSDVSLKTICIFDAFDECFEFDQGRLIQKLQLFHRQPSSSTQDAYLKFLITSRPYDHIQNPFRANSNLFPHLHLKGEEENDQIRKEIDLVVKLEVKQLALAQRLSPEVQQKLEQQLLKMEHRTYLWLHLTIGHIGNEFRRTLLSAEEGLKAMQINKLIPHSVNDAYKRILSRVSSDEAEIAKKILQIIVAARRPLTTVEMAMALGIANSPQSRTATKARIDSSVIVKRLRYFCGPFVFINGGKVSLIHQTAREFLISESNPNNKDLVYSWRLSDAERQMAQICSQYLLMEDLLCDNSRLCSNTRDFFSYSAVHWPYHVSQTNLASDPETVERVHRLYDTSGKSFSLWFPVFWKATMPHKSVPAIGALNLAAFNGHEQEVEFLLRVHKGDVSIPDSTNTHAIQWASLNGHERVVQILLDHGACVNSKGGDYGYALVAACFEGHMKVVQLLLKRGAHINAQGGRHGYALVAACFKGHMKIVQLLLKRGAHVNAQGGRHGYALVAACFKGHMKIVQLLLKCGAHVNAQGGRHGNALQAACAGGHDKITQFLLQEGAAVNAQGGFYGNALQAACVGGYDKIVRDLLVHGADVNAQGGEYSNALQAVFHQGWATIAEVLLDHGADKDILSDDGSIPLIIAAKHGYSMLVELLLTNRADFWTRGERDRTLFHIAARGGHLNICRLLITKNGSINPKRI